MELTKHPETELEYWQTIESLGGFNWRMNHDLADGRINDPTGAIDRDIADSRAIQAKLVAELKEKFGVIPPNECPQVEIGQKPPKAPKGKKYYWDWYQEMKELSYHMEYEGLICSACPLSKGVKEMISLGGVIPCGPWRGMIYQLVPPYECAMTSHDLWSREKLEAEILKKGGEPALLRFKIKEAGLKALQDLETSK